MWPTTTDRRPFVVALTGLVALTWASLWALGRSPYGASLGHHGHAAGWGVYVFVAGWTLMIVAMMLPTSLPLVALFHSFVRARPNRTRLTGLVVAGYLWIWTLFGIVLHEVTQLVQQSSWTVRQPWAFGAGIVLLAGLYQFTPLKHKCLEKCRSPLAFIMEHWHGERGEHDAFRLGVHHGLFCVGCCWSLMLLMFAVGVGNVAWMLALAVVMAVEKNLSWGRRLTAPLGLILVCSALVVVLAEAT